MPQPNDPQDYGSGTDPQMVIDAVELGRRQGSREAQVEAKVDKQLEMVRHHEGGPMGTATGPPYDWERDPDVEESGQRSRSLVRRFKTWRDR